jgi:hypothetical protein
MLVVTNGDSAVAALKRSGIPGHIFPWRDPLHEGPVPHGLTLEEMSDVRARFIAQRGWGSEERVRQDFRLRDTKIGSARHHPELVLWFEHDLYDQLQLLQILAVLEADIPDDTILSMVCRDAFIGHTAPELLADWLEDRESLDDRHLALGALAWDAFTQSEPVAWAGLSSDDTAVLPFLAATVERHLEEFPAPLDGLSRTERQILGTVDAGAATPGSLFRACLELEDAPFMGDASFWEVLAGLSGGTEPLVIGSPGQGAIRPAGPRPSRDFLDQALEITPVGREVLAGRRDWQDLVEQTKWLGGVDLGRALWRWDPGARQLLSP